MKTTATQKISTAFRDPGIAANCAEGLATTQGSPEVLTANRNPMATTDMKSLPETPGQEKSAVQDIIMLHEAIISAARQSINKAVRIGELLTQEKSKLDHGHWLPWLARHIPFTDRCARNYMRLYENRDELKLENVSDLTSAYHVLKKHKRPNDPTVVHPNSEALADDAIDTKTQTHVIENDDLPTTPHLAVSIHPPAATTPAETSCVPNCTSGPGPTTVMMLPARSVELQLRELWNHANQNERACFLTWVEAESPELNFGPPEPAGLAGVPQHTQEGL